LVRWEWGLGFKTVQNGQGLRGSRLEVFEDGRGGRGDTDHRTLAVSESRGATGDGWLGLNGICLGFRPTLELGSLNWEINSVLG
jgi:hypothetical protein